MQRKLRRNISIIWIFLFCLTQLSGCSFIGRKFARADGAPNVDIDVSKIPDAVPKIEPLSKYGNTDYVVEGHRYHVLKSAKGYCKTGYASWYGTKFHNKLTSTNERYNVFNMTAASTELPLPTYVEVTNLLNGKKVIVKVNDRGPFRCHRIIDLSYAAAKKLGYAGRGTAPVRVVAIDPTTYNKPHYAATKVATHTKSGLYLQVGVFSKLASAEKLANRVTNLTSHSVHITHYANLYHVQVGPIANTAKRDQAKKILEQNGFDDVITVKI
jgi:rare lipoprotein A